LCSERAFLVSSRTAPRFGFVGEYHDYTPTPE
jgi:hypothetical protein